MHEPRRVLVIVNPAAGAGRAGRTWRRHADAVRRAFGGTEHVTQHPGEATAVARQAVAAGITHILAVGGDGTLHEVVNGLAGSALALGIVPAGTGNDFARSAGLLRFRAVEALLAGLAAGRTATVDLGRVHARYYLNVAGTGFDAHVAACVNALKRKLPGTLPYLSTALREAFRFTPPPLALTIDDQAARAPSPMLMVAAANAPAYGGGMRVCPGALLDDGRLHVLLVGDVRGWQTVRLLPRVFRGTHVRHREVQLLTAGRLAVDGPSHIPVHADGEVLGGLPATFEICAGALRLWTPARAGRA